MGQAILDVSAFPPAEQGDPLVQRRLDDARWLPNIPLAAYKDAKYETAEGQVHGIQPIRRFLLDTLLGSVPEALRERVWATAMPDDCARQFLLNIYHEHHADFARLQGMADSGSISEKQRLQLAMKEATTMLGLQSSHDTHTRIPRSRLEQHKERLAELWPTLWKLLGQPKKAIKRKDQGTTTLGEFPRLCRKYRVVFRRFSGFKLNAKDTGRTEDYEWHLTLDNNMPHMLDVVHAVTIEAEPAADHCVGPSDMIMQDTRTSSVAGPEQSTIVADTAITVEAVDDTQEMVQGSQNGLEAAHASVAKASLDIPITKCTADTAISSDLQPVHDAFPSMSTASLDLSAFGAGVAISATMPHQPSVVEVADKQTQVEELWDGHLGTCSDRKAGGKFWWISNSDMRAFRDMKNDKRLMNQNNHYSRQWKMSLLSQMQQKRRERRWTRKCQKERKRKAERSGASSGLDIPEPIPDSDSLSDSHSSNPSCN